MPCRTIYSINALTLWQARSDPAFAQALLRADLLIADGVGAAWACRRLTGRPVERVAGIDLLNDLARVCSQEQQRVFLLGGAAGVAERAGTRLAQCHPGLQIAGLAAGFWPPEAEAGLLERINVLRPDLLLVGLGQPKQELFLDRYRDQLDVRVAMGVGGSLDVLAGDLRRAPAWMRAAGLEWLFRLVQEPWRSKQLWALCRFVVWILTTRRKA